MYYFLPNEHGAPSEEVLQQKGLGHAFVRTVTSRATDAGPGGAAGVLVSALDLPIHYSPDKQTWRRLPTTDIWFGWDATVGPDKYERESQLRGEAVRFSDGREWIVPTARDFADGRLYCALPMAYQLQDDGVTWGPSGVLPQYQRYWERSLELAEKWFHADQRLAITFNDMFEFVADGLSLNYRLSRLEIGVLGLLSSDSELFRAVLDAAFCMRRLGELQATDPQKKNVIVAGEFWRWMRGHSKSYAPTIADIVYLGLINEQ